MEKSTLLPPKTTWKSTLRKAPEPVFLLYVFALMLDVPLVQQYVYSRISEMEGFPYKYSGHQSSCNKGQALNSTLKILQEKVQAKTAYFQIGQSMCTAIPSFVMCFFLGTWSDKVGRKPVISIGLFGGVLESMFALLTMFLELPLYFLYIGGFFNAMGGFTGLSLAVMSYIADCTEKEQRALRLGILEAVVFTGAMLSNFMSGHLISAYGFKFSYIVVAACMLASFIYSVFILPESLANPVRNINNVFGKDCFFYPKRIWLVLTKQRPGKWKIGYMLAAALMINMLIMGVSPVVTLYGLNSPFCLPSIEIGYFIGTRFLLLGIGAACGIKLLGKFLPEYSVAFLGLLSYAAFYVLLAFAKEKLMLYMACAAGCISGVCGPIFRGILSKTVGPDEQGSLFSAVSSLEMLGVFAGSFLFNAFYAFANKHSFPGATFLLIALLLLIPFLLNVIYTIKVRKEDKELQAAIKRIIPESYEEENQNKTMANPVECTSKYGSFNKEVC